MKKRKANLLKEKHDEIKAAIGFVMGSYTFTEEGLKGVCRHGRLLNPGFIKQVIHDSYKIMVKAEVDKNGSFHAQSRAGAFKSREHYMRTAENMMKHYVREGILVVKV